MVSVPDVEVHQESKTHPTENYILIDKTKASHSQCTNTIVKTKDLTQSQLVSDYCVHRLKEQGSRCYIYRIPEEVLSEIFISCLPKDDYLEPHSMAVPILFSYVCRDWRDISIRTPQLWCRIKLLGERAIYNKRILPIWLKRSGSLPISFELSPCRCPAGSYRKDYEVIVEVLAGYSGRWKDVVLRAPGSLFEFPLLRSITDYFYQAPSLKSVYVLAYDVGCINLCGAMLEKVSIHTRSSSSILSLGYNRSSRIREITIDTANSIDEILSYLQYLPLLERANLCVNVGPMSTTVSSDIHLQHLNSLGIHIQPCRGTSTENLSWGRIFDRVEVPALRTLEISISLFHEDDISTNLSHVAECFLKRGTQSLISTFVLQLRLLERTPNIMRGVVACLKELPHLRILQLCICPSVASDDLDIARELTSQDKNAQTLCPVLEELTLKGCTPRTKEVLFGFIRRRQLDIFDEGDYLVTETLRAPLRKLHLYTVDGDPFRNIRNTHDFNFVGLASEDLDLKVTEWDDLEF